MDRGPWTIPWTWSIDPGPWTRFMDPVHGQPHGPPLISNRKSPLSMLKYTGGQSINKNTDSYLLLTSLRVCLVIAGCFGIAPYKWEDHELVLRYRRSSAFLPPIFSFQLVNLMGKQECIQFPYWIKRDLGGGRLPDNITRSSPFALPHPRWQLLWNDPKYACIASYVQSQDFVVLPRVKPLTR